MSYIQEDQYDAMTGELLGRQLKITKKVNNADFIQVYLSDMEGLMGLSTKGEMQVMVYLWKMSNYVDGMDYPGNYIIINTVVLDLLSKYVKLNVGSIKNVIATLVKKKLLLKGQKRTLYFLNSKYFFKGSLKDRVKSYNISIDYQIDTGDFDQYEQ
jgi:hypothetical protein